MNEAHQHPIQPGSSVNNKTGSWKLSQPIHDHEVCIGCQKCVMYCPDACTFKIDQKNSRGQSVTEVDMDYCKGCGACAAVCPVKAITMTPIE